MFIDLSWIVGLAMECYLLTNNMGCTLMLPIKYRNQVEGLAINSGLISPDVIGSQNTSDPNQYCLSGMYIMNDLRIFFSKLSFYVRLATLRNPSHVTYPLLLQNSTRWLKTSASKSFQDFVETECSTVKNTIAYDFCIQDTIMTQSPLSGSLTRISSQNYINANRVFSEWSVLILLFSFDFGLIKFTYRIKSTYNNFGITNVITSTWCLFDQKIT